MPPATRSTPTRGHVELPGIKDTDVAVASPKFNANIFNAIEMNTEFPDDMTAAQLAEQNDVKMTPLVSACAFDRATHVSLLIKKKASPSLPVPVTGNTALHVAASKGSMHCVELLLAAKAAIHTPNAERFTPVHLAATNGHADCVEVLLLSASPRAHAIVAIGDACGMTALHWSSKFGYEAVLRVLLNFQADPCQTDKCGRNPLWHARDQQNCRLYMERVLEQQRAIIQAAKLNNVETVLEMLDNFNLPAPVEAAHWAVIHGNLKVIMRFVASGISYDTIRDFASIPVPPILIDALGWNKRFMRAIAAADWTTASTLMDKSACVNSLDSNGKSPLHYASKEGPLHCIQQLLDRRADILHRDSEGWSPLLYATFHDRYNIVALLIGNKADPQVASFSGVYPMHIAMKRNDMALLYLTYVAKKERTSTDMMKFGLSPFDKRFLDLPEEFLMAVHLGSADAIYLFLSKVLVTKRQSYAQSAFHAAVLMNRLNVAHKLVAQTQWYCMIKWDKVFSDTTAAPVVAKVSTEKVYTHEKQEVRKKSMRPKAKRALPKQGSKGANSNDASAEVPVEVEVDHSISAIDKMKRALGWAPSSPQSSSALGAESNEQGSVEANEKASVAGAESAQKEKVESCVHVLKRMRKNLEEFATTNLYKPFYADIVSVPLLDPISTEALRMLFKQGASHEYEDPITKETPLMAQAKFGNLTFVQALLKSGADPLKQDNTGRMAIKYATNKRVIRCLSQAVSKPLCDMTLRDEPILLRLDGLPKLDPIILEKWITTVVQRFEKEVQILLPTDVFRRFKGFAYLFGNITVLRKLADVLNGYVLYEEIDVLYKSKASLIMDVEFDLATMQVEKLRHGGHAQGAGVKVGWILSKVNRMQVPLPSVSISRALRMLDTEDKVTAQFRGPTPLANMQAIIEKQRV